MTILAILTVGVLVVLLGRLIFGRWFNHVSLYAAIWSGTLCMFEIRLIKYYPLEAETWLLILSGGIAFLLGALTISILRNRTMVNMNPPSGSRPYFSTIELQRLKIMIWALSAISLPIALYNLHVAAKEFGGLLNVLALGNLLYKYRLAEGGVPGSVPYLGHLSLVAILFSGIYIRQTARISLVSIIPIFTVVLMDVSIMGRALIVIGAILFSVGYFLSPTPLETTVKPPNWWRKFSIAILILSIFAGSIEFVRSHRGTTETFAGATAALSKIRGASFFTPSIYLYLSSHYGVFNQYLKNGEEGRPIGGHTFLPFYRVLNKIGFDVSAETYQTAHRTPVRTNTGTYLRELHADFGILGVLLGPYFIGLLTSLVWFRVLTHARYTDIVLAGYLFTIVGMSSFVMATRVAVLAIYLVFGLVAGFYLDCTMKRGKRGQDSNVLC